MPTGLLEAARVTIRWSPLLFTLEPTLARRLDGFIDREATGLIAAISGFNRALHTFCYILTYEIPLLLPILCVAFTYLLLYNDYTDKI